MRIGLVIYGSLATMSGGYLYDRMLVEKLRMRGDSVEIISMSRQSYGVNFVDNLRDWQRPGLDLILQDELNHPSLFLTNRRKHRAPILSIVHHLRSSERRWALENTVYRGVERLYLNSLDGFVFNSDTTRRSVERLTGKEMQCVVATPGGDRLGTTSPARVRARASQPGPLRMVFIGNLVPAKGLDVLLRALGELPSGAFHLEVIGSEDVAPTYAARIRGRAKALHLPVTFRGPLSERALSESLQESHVLALTSYYEGFGIALLEGMAHGLAALASRAGAVTELVTNGENGYLVEPGDAHALAGHLAELARDRALLGKLGVGALKSYSYFPTWDQTTDRIREFLLTVAPRRASEAPTDPG